VIFFFAKFGHIAIFKKLFRKPPLTYGIIELGSNASQLQKGWGADEGEKWARF
jgi:hypothetical protein